MAAEQPASVRSGARLLRAVRRRFGTSSSSGFITSVTLVGVVATSFAAVVGSGHASNAIDFLDGGGWLPTFSTGTVSHVGPTGGIDASVTLEGAEGHELELVQADGVVVVVDRITGEVGRIDAAVLEVTQRVDFGDGPALDVVVGRGLAFVIDRVKGTVTPVDPDTLKALGDAVSLGGPATRGVIGEDGSLYVGVRGSVLRVRDGAVYERVRAGRAEEVLDLVLLDGAPVVFNYSKGTAAVVTTSGLRNQVTLPEEHSHEVKVARSSRGQLKLVSNTTGALLLLDLSSGDIKVEHLGRDSADFGEPTENGARIYVPDYAAGDLVEVAAPEPPTAPARAPARVSGPLRRRSVAFRDQSGRFDAFVKDGTLFVNDPVSDAALLVDEHGTPIPVGKGAEEVAGNNEPPATTTTTTLPPPPAGFTPGRPGAPSRSTPTQPGSGPVTTQPALCPPGGCAPGSSPGGGVPTPPGSPSPTAPGSGPSPGSPAQCQPPTVDGVSVAPSGSSGLSVNWTGFYPNPAYFPECTPLRWEVALTEGGATVRSATVTACCQAAFSGLPRGTYSGRVIAQNPGGSDSNSGGSATIAVAPSAPTGLSSSLIDAENAQLTWGPPADDGGKPINGYFVSSFGGTSGTSATVHVGCGVTQTFTVNAWNDVGNGPGASTTITGGACPP